MRNFTYKPGKALNNFRCSRIDNTDIDGKTDTRKNKDH